MKQHKIRLIKIKIKSFVTELESAQQNWLKGGQALDEVTPIDTGSDKETCGNQTNNHTETCSFSGAEDS